MKSSLTSIILFIVAFSTIGQGVLAPFSEVGSDKWGYMNQKGEVVLPAKYDEVLDFSAEGLSLVREGKTWSIIDKKGTPLSTVNGFTPVSIFGFGKRGYENGYLVVGSNKLLGVLDVTGKVVHDFKYNYISDFHGGFAAAKIGKSFYILDKDGKSTGVDDVLDLKEFAEGLAPFRAKDKLYGFMDPTGKITIPATFQSVGYFSNGLAWAKTTEGTIGFIDKSGKWVIEPKFLATKDFDGASGIARVKVGEEWMFIRKNGETFAVDGMVSSGDFSDGLAYARKGDLYGFVNEKGEWVIEAKYTKVRDFNGGFAAVQINELWGVIDKKGNVVCEPKFRDIKNFN